MDRSEESFCHPALPIRELNGRTVALQTDGTGTVCEVGETVGGMETLGTDCKVRAPDGSVVEFVQSSREDGTCGSDSPTP